MNRGQLRITPLSVLVLNLLLAVTGVLAALTLAGNQPWLGIDFVASEQAAGLRIASVAPDSPAQNRLRAGQSAVAIQADGHSHALEPQTLLEEPDFLRSYSEYNAFLAKQARLHRALQAHEVTLHSGNGDRILLQPAQRRPIHDLPPAFWFQLIFAVVCLGIGTSVWAVQRSIAAGLFGLTGVGLFFVGVTAAVYSTRELALGAPLFRILAAGNHAGGMLFAGAFMATLWHYPRPLGHKAVTGAILTTYFLLWSVDTAQWLPGMDAGFRIPLLIGLLVSVWLAIWQWRRTNAASDRAALRWFLFAWFFGSALFVALMFVPVLLGSTPLLPQSYSFGLLLIIYAGVAAGVARYRLFSLERWWYPTLAGSFALLAVLVLLPLVVRYAGLSQMATAVIAFGILGWVYFPARNWLRRRIARRWRQRTAPAFEQAVELLFDPTRGSDVDLLWTTLLRQLLDPLEIQAYPEFQNDVEVSRDGSTLYIPTTEHTSALRLRWPARGARLFDPADIRTVRALLPLVSRARDLRAAWARGAATERARLKQDLEDDLAPRLYSQILRAASAPAATGARSALAEIRLLIDQLDTGEVELAEALAEWRAQIEDLCEIGGLPLRWHQPDCLPHLMLGPQWRGNPLRILREAANNALAHARPTYMEVAVAIETGHIILTVAHDGVDRAPDTWEPGRGLINIKTRARQLAGEVQWSQSQPDSVKMRVRLRLNPAQ